jgi:hypothetical protein
MISLNEALNKLPQHVPSDVFVTICFGPLLPKQNDQPSTNMKLAFIFSTMPIIMNINWSLLCLNTAKQLRQYRGILLTMT